MHDFGVRRALAREVARREVVYRRREVVYVVLRDRGDPAGVVDLEELQEVDREPVARPEHESRQDQAVAADRDIRTGELVEHVERESNGALVVGGPADIDAWHAPAALSGDHVAGVQLHGHAVVLISDQLLVAVEHAAGAILRNRRAHLGAGRGGDHRVVARRAVDQLPPRAPCSRRRRGVARGPSRP